MDFRARYRRECLLADTAPLHVIESSLGDASLKFNFFRIPPPEWGPLLTALESDVTLKKIIVTIDYNEYTVNNPTHQLKLKHLPAFIKSLSYHLSNNANIINLSLNGIPLSDAMVETLIKGLLPSKNLQHLNLSLCKLSNNQALKIFNAIEKKPKLVWLELCSCGLTSRCKEGLLNLIQNQATSRENAAWKASLRDESASLELMGGLRRLSLSDNDLGDAIDQLALALCQDNCLKALDLQYCQVENGQLELLIEAITKNPALVFVDIANNNGLDTTLVLELHSVLNSKVRNETNLSFMPLTVSKRFVIPNQSVAVEKRTPAPAMNNKSVTTPVNIRKTPVRKTITAKPTSSSVTAKSPSGEEKAKGHGKQNCQDTEDSLNSIREELRRERELRLDAERQVIKMYAEMESAWIKISKLEKEVKKLKKQKSTFMSGSYAIQTPYSQAPSLLVDQPTLKDFHLCLGQLRNILQRLSWDPAMTRDANASLNAKTCGIEGILRSLHAAVNDLALSVNIPEREKETQTPSGSRPCELHSYNQNCAQDPRIAPAFQTSKRAAYDFPMHSTYSQREPTEHFTRKATETVREIVIHPELQESSPLQGRDFNKKATRIVGERNFTSTPVSSISAPKRKPQMSPSALVPNSAKPTQYSKASKADDAPLPQNESSSSLSKSLRDENSSLVRSSNGSSVKKQNGETSDAKANSTKSAPKERISSLKNLQNNLEGLLQQFQTRKVEPLEMSRYTHSLLPANDGASVSEGENVRTEKSEYSMDFDSTTTSIRTITNELKKLSHNATPSLNNIPPIEKLAGNSRKTKEKATNSRSSSTLNLSSIVDLLGDFSVGDIGSSTLTPP